MFKFWLRFRRQSLLQPSSLTRQACRSRRPRFQPHFLQLEDRVMPTVNVTSTFLGMNFGNTPGYVPPDTCAASGPSEIIETVNTDIAIYNKSGAAILSPTNLATFFASVGPINQLSDSAVEYDELNGTFFIGVLNLTISVFGTPSADSYLYAVSNNSSPTSASDFTFHSVNLTNLDPAGSGSYWGDFPRIGWNATAYVASFNMFTNGARLGHPGACAGGHRQRHAGPGHHAWFGGYRPHVLRRGVRSFPGPRHHRRRRNQSAQFYNRPELYLQGCCATGRG
jgi:hypothetical protein